MARNPFRFLTLAAIALTACFGASRAALAATPLSTISGTVADNAGGSGVQKVDAYLLRSNGGTDEYWAKRSGTWGWGTSVVAIPTTISGGTWSVTASSPAGTQFPSGGDWLDGVYRVKATAFDNAGNSATSTVNTFTVDSVSPTSCIVTSPANGSTIPSLAAGISGSASDNANGSGIGSVIVYLRRYVGSSYQYWGFNSGSSQYEWSTAVRTLNATLASPNAVNTNWTLTANLPSGANLADGKYYIHAAAYDRAGGVVTSATNTVTVNQYSADTTVPDSVTIAAPTHGSTIVSTTLGSINGNASDNTGGSGIARVELYLRRFISGAYQYWGVNPSTNTLEWGSTPRTLTTALGTPNGITTTWFRTSGLPLNADLPTGSYFIHVIAFDRAGNSKQSSIHTISLINDTAAPTNVAVTSPANGASVLNLNSVSGTASDDAAGSGITKVELYLRRFVSGAYQYWGLNTTTSQYEWSTTVRTLPTAVSPLNGLNVTWVRSSNMPSGATNLPSGTYYLHATAYDRANRIKTSSVNTVTVLTDTVVPASVAVTTPANGANVTSLSSISGSASDNAGGSGINRVDVILRRFISGAYQFWGESTTGSGVYQWNSTARSIPAVVTPLNGINTTWLLNSNLPSGVSLPSGTYFVHATAWDRANNIKTSSVNSFTVVSAGLVANQGYTLSGRITLSSGAGLASASVVLRNAAGTQIAATTTDANGSYWIDDVPAGRYTVAPSAAGYTFSPQSRTVDVDGADVDGLNYIGSK